MENIYGGDEKVTKYECVGHYQKRVGNRRRKLKKKVQGSKELKEETIDDELQYYFGIVLRSNVTSTEAMSNDIFAPMLHQPKPCQMISSLQCYINRSHVK